MKGITKRWVMNTFGVILIILCVLTVAFAVVVQSLYYNGIRQTLSGRSGELSGMFSGNISFMDEAIEYVEGFPDKEMMELIVISQDGEPIINSTGFTPEKDQEMPDYKAAFVFLEDQYEDRDVPVWAIKIILEKDEGQL